MAWRADAATWVDARPFRAHLSHLLTVSGLPLDALAEFVQVPPRALRSLLHGRSGRPLRKISPQLARCLLDVTTADARGVSWLQVPAAATRGRLNELLRAGRTVAELAQRTRQPAARLDAVLAGAEHCGLRLALCVQALLSAELDVEQPDVVATLRRAA